MNNAAKEFDDKAATWDDNPERALRSQIIADAMIRELPNDLSLSAMEYGCGTGLLSFPLRTRFAKITLADTSEGMLDVLREKIVRSKADNMEVVNVDLLGPSASLAASFSVIYCAMVLHHIENVQKLLTAWYSHLTSPGYLCIADLDSDNGLFHGPEFKGHNGFDRNELREVIEEAGFVDVRFSTVYKIKKETRDGIVRTFPLFLMVCKKNPG